MCLHFFLHLATLQGFETESVFILKHSGAG